MRQVIYTFLVILLPSSALGQGDFLHDSYPYLYEYPYIGYNRPSGHRDSGWSFCTLRYRKVRSFPAGNGHLTDLPGAGMNLMKRASQLTFIRTEKREHQPDRHRQFIVDPSRGDGLSMCPFVFTSDVGTLAWRGEQDIWSMKQYLLKGGFLWTDDSWGAEAWSYWEEQLRMVLPEDDYPIISISPEHEIFNSPYAVEMWQMPNVGFWKRHGGATSELESESDTPYFLGINDDHGRLMVLMTHNTDVADAWERESDVGFFESFAGPGYSLGLNVLLYVMTH